MMLCFEMKERKYDRKNTRMVQILMFPTPKREWGIIGIGIM